MKSRQIEINTVSGETVTIWIKQLLYTTEQFDTGKIFVVVQYRCLKWYEINDEERKRIKALFNIDSD